MLHFKGELCSFGDEIQTQNFDIYSINETQKHNFVL